MLWWLRLRIEGFDDERGIVRLVEAGGHPYTGDWHHDSKILRVEPVLVIDIQVVTVSTSLSVARSR